VNQGIIPVDTDVREPVFSNTIKRKIDHIRIRKIMPAEDHDTLLTKKYPHVPERISGLVDLAYNLWWSWTPEAQMLFKQLSPHAWIESIHNPVRMLRDLPQEMLERAAGSPQYTRHYDLVIARFRQETRTTNSWFSGQVSNSPMLPIAYFSAEYGLHHSLPFYAGGLGFLSGDHLKESSDLGVPMVAVGFMYGEGYLHQHIRADGWQEDIKEMLDRDAAPVVRIMENAREQLVVKIPFFEPPMYVAVWKVDIGRVPLYLLDTDIEINKPEFRFNFSRLYTGGVRLQQEIILGIGGCTVLDKLGIEHSAIHIRGFPFALLERIRKKVADGMTFEQAMQATRGTNIFTTHTPVPAGHDLFPYQLMDTHFSRYYDLLGIDRKTFLGLGHNPRDPGGLFNMTALGLKMSDYRNAVSRKHGSIARRMWQPLWPGIPEEKVPSIHHERCPPADLACTQDGIPLQFLAGTFLSEMDG
jgi:starch phosphorylase